MDTIALENLRVVSAIGAVLFGAIAVTKPLALMLLPTPVPPSFVLAITAWEAATALLLLGIHGLVRRHALRQGWANAALASVAVIVLLGALAQMLVIHDALRTVAVILIMLAAAFFVTSARWFVATLVASLVGWIAVVAMSPPFAGVGLLAIFIVQAVVLATIVFVARTRTIRKLELLHVVDALRAHELEETVEAKARAEGDLAAALSECKVIMETVPDLIYRLDADGRLVAWNKQVETVLGATPEELAGRPCAAFVIPAERPLIPGLLQNCIDMGIAEAELHLLRRDGPPILYQVLKAPILDAAGVLRGFAGVARDVSARRIAERRLAAQYAATSVLAAGGAESDTTAEVLATVGRALDWRVGTAWTVTADGQRLKCIGTWTCDDQHREFVAWTCARSFPRGVGLPGRVWAGDGPLWVEDMASDPDLPRSAIARQEGLHAAFAFPIKNDRETIGVMEFFSDRRESLDQDLLQMMSSLGHQMGAFVQRKRNQERIWHLNADLATRVEELAAANRGLETFSYTVSHDLRAPLRGIRYFAELAHEAVQAGQTEEAAAHAERICDSADRMSEIIEDMLALSRAGSGELRRVDVDLARMTRELVQELRMREPGRNVDVVVPERLMVEGDAGLLRTVMENLLGNAWKFTRPAASPRIEVGILDHAGEHVVFVRDNGAGFDMARADRLFRPFQRLHSEKQFEGTGVGLATVQRIVHRHGGRIWAEAAPGLGATFYFTVEPRPSAATAETEMPSDAGARFEAPSLPPPAKAEAEEGADAPRRVATRPPGPKP